MEAKRMKRIISVICLLTLVFLISASTVGTVSAQENEARVRVVHASPDAPAVDILVDGQKAFSNISFKTITPYAALAPGSHQVQVVAAGTNGPAVINTTLNLSPNTDYTVVASGTLANIAPLVLTDNNAAPPAGQAKIRLVHAAPNAPAVDVAVAGGPVLFSNIAFGQAGAYVPVNAGTYTLEVRPAGTTNAVLSVPGVVLQPGNIYTAFAVGLLNGQPPLQVVLSNDAARSVVAGAATTAPSATTTAAPITAAKAGEPGSTTASISAVSIGLLLIAGSLWRRRKSHGTEL
jgi:hypothetical protein